MNFFNSIYVSLFQRKSFRKRVKKHKQTELDVDFIGGQGPLTKDEEQAISKFIKAQKLLKAKKQIRRTRTTARTRVTA